MMAAPKKPQMEGVPNCLSDHGPAPAGADPPDIQDLECRPSPRTDLGEMKSQSMEQGWTSTQTREQFECPAAAEGIGHDETPYTRAKGQGDPSARGPSGLEMRTYALSRVYASAPARHEHSPAHGPSDQDSRSLDRPDLRRYRSWLSTRPSCHSPASGGRVPQPRRWSMWMSDGTGSQCPPGETGMRAHECDVATVGGWCEEFRETRVSDWQQTVAAFGQMWKGWCFAQRQARAWQDNLIRGAMDDFWQPLSDFEYVLSLYSFLEGVKNRNLLPHLRRRYMTWRSAEQTRLHEAFDLGDGEDGSSEKNTPGDGISQDAESMATTNRYPLTTHQHLRVARVCGDVDRGLKRLQHWLDDFQGRREVCIRAIKEARLSYAAMAECRWNLTDAAREFSSHADTVVNQLRDSRTCLCEALGLDPNQVPGGGDAASVPTMTAMKYEKAPKTPSPCRGGLALPRGFWLRKASLQAGRIALQANLYITVLPCKIAQGVLERMMARSTEMAIVASEAGDYRAEATVQRLHNKLRKVYERAGQEFPDMKPKMTLLDSETWPAVLSPRKDLQVEVHDDGSTPVETLIDILLAPRASASIPRGSLGRTGNRLSADSTITTPSGSSQPLTTSSSAEAVPEAESHEF